MKIKDILECESGDLLPSIDRCKIIAVADVKPGAECDIQFATIRDEEGNILKLLIRNSKYFLKKENVDDAFSIIAGPPKNKKPQGLTYMVTDKGTKQVKIEDAGNMIIGDDPGSKPVEKSGVEKVQETIYNLPEGFEDDPNPQLTEKSDLSAMACNTVYELIPGPSDTMISGYAKERFHIFAVIFKEARENPESVGFPHEKLAELATSCHMLLEKNNKSILAPSQSKDKFQSKEHNNPAPKKAAEVKEEKKPEPKTEPAAKKEESKTQEEIISNHLKTQRKTDSYNITDAGGEVIGKLMEIDGEKRAKMLQWKFTNSPANMTEGVRKIFSAITALYRSGPISIQYGMILEALRYDQAKIRGLPYDESNFDKFDSDVMAIMTRFKPDSLKPTAAGTPNYVQIASDYFSIDLEDRSEA